MTDVYTIYSMTDPRTGAVFYIGQTVNFARRVAEHLKCRSTASSRNRVSQLLNLELVPIFQIISRENDRQTADKREREEIALQILAGRKLVNAIHETSAARKLIRENEQALISLLAQREASK